MVAIMVREMAQSWLVLKFKMEALRQIKWLKQSKLFRITPNHSMPLLNKHMLTIIIQREMKLELKLDKYTDS